MYFRYFLRVVVTLFVAGGLFLASSCAMLKAPSQILREEGINGIRIGIAPNFPPVVFKKDDIIAGIEVDMAERLRRELDLSIIYVELPFNDLLGALNANEIDVIMSGMSVTKKRGKLARFTHPYMEIGQVAIVRKADIPRFTPSSNILYVNGLRVGYEVFTTGMSFVVEKLLLAELVDFQSPDEGLTALKGGEIEVFIHDDPTALRMNNQKAYKDLIVLPKPLTREKYAWAVRHEDKVLFKVLNRTLDNWKKQGTLQPVIDKWLTQPYNGE